MLFPPWRSTFQVYRNISYVDYILYDHFNKTLWKAISSEPDISAEVQELRSLQQEVENFCSNENYYQKPNKIISGMRFSDDIVVDTFLCEEMASLTLTKFSRKAKAKCKGCMSKAPPDRMRRCYSRGLGRYGFCWYYEQQVRPLLELARSYMGVGRNNVNSALLDSRQWRLWANIKLHTLFQH